MSPDDQKEIDALIASLSESSGPEDIANKLLHIQRIVGEDRLTATLYETAGKTPDFNPGMKGGYL